MYIHSVQEFSPEVEIVRYKWSHNFRVSILLTHLLESLEDIQSGNTFMSSLWVTKNLEIRRFTLEYIYK